MFPAFLAGFALVAVLVTRLWLGLADRLADVGRSAVALADAAFVTLVVLELRKRDDLDGDLDLTRSALAEVAVLDEVGQVLAALFADLAESLQVVSQSHR